MNKKYLNEIIATTDKEFTDEELIHQLLDEKVSSSPAGGDRTTFGQRAADAVARFAGSWGFIFSFLLCMAVWMLINILMAANAFDAYPFILLNLVLSCIAAVQAPLIMMSQNRQEAKDRLRAENDYCQRRNYFDRKRRSEMTHIAGHTTAGISAGGTV